MSLRFPDARIVLFAKEPQWGQVKTRLQPRLGEAGCLALYRRLLQRTGRMALAAQLAPVHLWVTGNPRHEDFLALCPEQDIHSQQGADLGERMDHAATAVLNEGSGPVLIIGMDCPVMDRDYLARALEQLAGGVDVVLGPAEDGGYMLVGLARPVPAMFTGIDWGADTVLAQTLARLDDAGVSYALLETLWDVDREEDLARLDLLEAVELRNGDAPSQ